MMDKPFAERMKEHQTSWASKNGLNHLLEPRHDSQQSWVLKKEHKTRNLQNPAWWSTSDAMSIDGPGVSSPVSVLE